MFVVLLNGCFDFHFVSFLRERKIKKYDRNIFNGGVELGELGEGKTYNQNILHLKIRTNPI